MGSSELFKVEILNNPLCEIVMFMWKEYLDNSWFLTIRYQKSTWKIKIMDKTSIQFEFDHKKTIMSLNGCFIGKDDKYLIYKELNQLLN